MSSTNETSQPSAQKRVYEIDGKDFETPEGFYDTISRVLIPGAKWGRNLDAFNDILGGDFGTPDEGYTIHWRNSAVSRERLGYPMTVHILRKIMTKCHPANIPTFKKRLQDAENGRGDTVFDWLVEIIRDNGEGGIRDHGVKLILD